MAYPENYRNILGSAENTEKAIKYVKDMFQENLSAQLTLLRVTAPMVVLSGTGLNDDLNGIERPVRFPVKGLGDADAEVVHSLAKWKRLKLSEMGVPPGRGIYTDMNALRPDEDLDCLHSIYVDQWDWERVIAPQERNLEFLKKIVRRIYESLKVTENKIYVEFPQIAPVLPDEIKFYHGLNGDILLWNPVLENAFEISSMGIRVDPEALRRQLETRHEEWKSDLYFHRRLLAGGLPSTIGGGIGQSRLCMFLLRKAHIGEIQCAIWPENMRRECIEHGICLL